LAFSQRLKTRTGFPFHSLPFPVDTKNSSRAPDNFGGDPNRGESDWQVAADGCGGRCLLPQPVD
jgi:hypothetical protein